MWFKLTKKSLAVRLTTLVPTQTLSLLSAETPGFFSLHQDGSSHRRSMCERIPLHHLRCTCHDGGVSVIPFTCVLPALPQVPTPSSAILATSATLPARRVAPVRMESLYGVVRYKQMCPATANKKPLSHFHTPTHTVTHFSSRTQTRVHRNYHLQDVMMWLYYIDPARLPSIMRRDKWDQRGERHAGANVRFCY